MAWIAWGVAWRDEGYGVERFAVGDVPGEACLGLEVGYQEVAEDLVAGVVCEDGVCKVVGDGGWVAEVVREEDGFGTEVGDVVKPGDDVVPVVRTCVAISLVGLTAKVAEEDDGWRVQAVKDGPDESFKVLHCVGVGRVVCIELDDDEVTVVLQAVCWKKRNISSRTAAWHRWSVRRRGGERRRSTIGKSGMAMLGGMRSSPASWQAKPQRQ